MIWHVAACKTKLKFYCPIDQKRIRKNCGTRDRREARKILRECRERLLNGAYTASGGAITEALEATANQVRGVFQQTPSGSEMSWTECVDRYRRHKQNRLRDKSLDHAMSRLSIAERILEGQRADVGLPEGACIAEYATLETMEYLQDRLLAGDECRYETRSPMTVNTTMGSILTFIRYCCAHGWIQSVPIFKRLDVHDAMKGRPITTEEFEQMLDAVPDVVGTSSANSWARVLYVLWESAFRVGDLMNFSWDDERRIYPIWPQSDDQHPTLAIPASQKNKKVQEIPMLPGLNDLLQQTATADRHEWVVNPQPLDYSITTTPDSCKPIAEDLTALSEKYNNSAIAEACGVTEASIRKWLKNSGISSRSSKRLIGSIDDVTMAGVRARASKSQSFVARRSVSRLTKEHVGRTIGNIGKKADIVVQRADEDAGKRVKYASAHDIRRGCAKRLIDAGISAETLKLVLRHKDFGTTERYYGATRAAQAAASEINEKLAAQRKKSELVGGTEEAPQLSAEELQKLKALLNAL